MSFVYLDQISRHGLTAAGNGTLRVTTPDHSYEPFTSHDVTFGHTSITTKANAGGQLTFKVVIGPAAVHEQRVFPASGPPPNVPHVEVSIAPAVRSASSTPRATHGSSRSWIVALGAAGAALLAVAVVLLLRRRRSPTT